MNPNERDKSKAERVTKLDAAGRQLRVAIRLFFQREDMVAVHTLAAAAQEVLRRIGRARGIKSIFLDEGYIDQVVRPEMRQEYRRLLTETQNFLKHAGRDPDGVLDFYPDATRFHLFDAAQMYCQLDPGGHREAAGFLCWYCMKYPHILNDGPIKELVERWTPKVGALTDFKLILAAIDGFNLQEWESP